MEQDGKLFCSEDEPSGNLKLFLKSTLTHLDKKSKGEDHSEDGEVDCESSQQKRKDDIICLDADEPSTSVKSTFKLPYKYFLSHRMFII